MNPQLLQMVAIVAGATSVIVLVLWYQSWRTRHREPKPVEKVIPVPKVRKKTMARRYTVRLVGDGTMQETSLEIEADDVSLNSIGDDPDASAQTYIFTKEDPDNDENEITVAMIPFKEILYVTSK